MLKIIEIKFRGRGIFGGMKIDGRMSEKIEGIRIEEMKKNLVEVWNEMSKGNEIWI